MTDEYKELLDIKFSHLLEKMEDNFTIVHTKLSSIDEQVKKTNGRVTKLEKDVVNIEKRDLTHILNCPQTQKINDINDQLMEYKIIKKYPKFFLAAFVILVIIIIYQEFALNLL